MINSKKTTTEPGGVACMETLPPLPTTVATEPGGVACMETLPPLHILVLDDDDSDQAGKSSSGFDMRSSIDAVETLLDYRFKNKMLLEEALTHPSYPDSASYERLEFQGDAALNLVFTNHLCLAYKNLDPGSLSKLRSANNNTEKLARVAVKHDLYRYLRRNVPVLDEKVLEFSGSIRVDNTVEMIKAPKVLADVVESIAGAVYVDCGLDLNLLWKVFKGLLEPIITPETLQNNPLVSLYEVCQKQGKRPDFKHNKKGTMNFIKVYVGGKLFGSGCSEHKEMAKLNASREALEKLGRSLCKKEVDECTCPMEVDCSEIVVLEKEEGAKRKLSVICSKSRLPQPLYRVEQETGPSHDKRYVCSVQMENPLMGPIIQLGHERGRVKDAENSAAYLMLTHLGSLEGGSEIWIDLTE